MANVRERWLSRRALWLHLSVLVFVPGCAVAAWWQINRAADGNQLSYLYSVLWPAFGLLGLYFWWMLIHTDYETVGLKGMQRQQAAVAQPDAEATEDAPPMPAVAAPTAPVSKTRLSTVVFATLRNALSVSVGIVLLLLRNSNGQGNFRQNTPEHSKNLKFEQNCQTSPTRVSS